MCEPTEIVYIFIVHHCLFLLNILQRFPCSSLTEFVKRKYLVRIIEYYL